MPVKGSRIQELIDSREGESQSSLARAIGMRQQGIQMIIAGKVDRPKKLREIATHLGTSQAYLLGETDDPSPEVAELDDLVRVPLISWVSAGRLTEANAIPTRDGKMLAFSDLGGGEFFALKVRGDSMDRVSPDGSIIVVNRRDRTPVDGKPYVFSLRGEATYKIWRSKPVKRLEPYSTNPSHEPHYLERQRDYEVVGRVKRTVLDL